MGHRISTQARGKGGSTYRAPSHQYKAELKHFGSATKTVRAIVADIEHDPARHTPIAVVYIDGKKEIRDINMEFCARRSQQGEKQV